MAILVLADYHQGAISASLSRVVSAARQIGGAVHVLVAGRDCAGIAQAAARIAGVEKVLLADHAVLEHHLAEPLADLLFGLTGNYHTLMAAASSKGKDVMPRLAALLDVMQVSEIVAVTASDTFDRRVYAGNVVLTVQATDPVRVLTVRAAAFEDAGMADGDAPIEQLAVGVESTLSRFVSQSASSDDRPDLTTAKIVVAGGRALGSKERFDELIFPLADRLGAAVGASRAAVDAGYIANEFQVGQTGKIVAPDLYIACGISGAIQHLAGMKDSRVIVAINNDSQAPIFQIADYGLVADIFEVMPEMIRYYDSRNH